MVKIKLYGISLPYNQNHRTKWESFVFTYKYFKSFQVCFLTLEIKKIPD